MQVSALEKRFFSTLEASLNVSIQGLFNSGIRKKQTEFSLCVALSGGLDSSVLLHLANRWLEFTNQTPHKQHYQLSAFHVNHGLSEHANNWEMFCKRKCEHMGISFKCAKLHIKKRVQHSLEADARDGRYKLLDEHAKLHSIVVLGQHQDDQLETILLQLKRGAGALGLGGMQSVLIRDSGTKYIRPLLGFSKEQLFEYAREQNIDWIEDESNQDTQFDRNFLRQNILPRLRERWPSIAKTASRSASLSTQAYVVNAEYMQKLSETIVDKHRNINISSLSEHSVHTQQYFLHFWVTNILKLKCTHKQQQALYDLVHSQQSSSTYLLFGDIAIERFQAKLLVSKGMAGEQTTDNNVQVLNFKQSQQIRVSNEYLLMTSAALTENLKAQVLVTYHLPLTGVSCEFAKSNVKFKYQLNRPRKTLKAWFQEWGVSPLERLKWPIFIFENNVIGVRHKQAENYVALFTQTTIEVVLVKSVVLT